MPKAARTTTYTALLLYLLSNHFVSAQDSPWDAWPFCASTCAGAASCETPTAPCVCSSIFLGCVKFSACNGADEDATMALVDSICGTVNGSTPSPPPPNPDPTTTTPRAPNPTNTPTPALPLPSSGTPTRPNASSATNIPQSSDSRSNSQTGTTNISSQPPVPTSATGSASFTGHADTNVLPTTIPGSNGVDDSLGVRSENRGPVIGGVIAGVIVLVGLLVAFLWKRRGSKVKDAEDSEKEIPSNDPTMLRVIPTPGLTPYAYRRAGPNTDMTESLPSTMEESCEKSGLRIRKVVNADDTETGGIQQITDLSTRHRAIELSLPGPSTAVEPSVSHPSASIATPSLLTSPTDRPASEEGTTRPFSMTSQDIIASGPELLPPPYHLIPGNN